MLIISKIEGLSFESIVTFKGGFKVRNDLDRKKLKSLVEIVDNSKIGFGMIGGWFSKKEEEKPKDKNEIKINIIQRKDKFPKVLMREGT